MYTAICPNLNVGFVVVVVVVVQRACYPVSSNFVCLLPPVSTASVGHFW